MFASAGNLSTVFIELGAAVMLLAVMARLANRFGFSAIPLYLIAGLAFGNGGLVPLRFGEEFVRIGAEVGVILLLFMLGLEYSGEKLMGTLKTGFPAGALDLALNFTPGLFAGMILGLHPMAWLLLGGVTYISSSGIIAKVLSELKRMGNPETAVVITILVLEDLTMAAYLPVAAVLLAGKSALAGLLSVGIALTTVVVVLFIAVRFGRRMSTFVTHQSDEVLLLSTLGLILLVSGIAQSLQVSAAVGAFLVGVAVSGPMVQRAAQLIKPLRDLFAATFFLFFGLQINPVSLVPALIPAIALGLLTTGTKIFTGWRAGHSAGLSRAESIRVGCTLVARGEFSIVIAELGTGVEPRLGPISAAYVLFLAILGPLLARRTWEPKPAA
jgi:CPA2 family monovalent cation:H+ antiporter-2